MDIEYIHILIPSYVLIAIHNSRMLMLFLMIVLNFLLKSHFLYVLKSVIVKLS